MIAFDDGCKRAADAIGRARALVISAGAGMGVDSGLPDFRGPEGFWRAYPPYRARGLAFEDLANPRWFVDDPGLAWGFYGHRLNLYRKTTPHEGFHVLARLTARMSAGAFVFTSNVDGQFQRAGFERVCEVHGAIEWLQCTRGATCGLWAAPPADVDVDGATFRARPPFPACPRCGAMARPNILMFGDAGWDDARTNAQHDALSAWLAPIPPADVVVVECGAGTAIPTVRSFGEQRARKGAVLVRINVREPQCPDGAIGIASGAKDALVAVESYIGAR